MNSGNDVYGNPIKRIQYEIKQIKVRQHRLTWRIRRMPSCILMLRLRRLLTFLTRPRCGFHPDVQGAHPGHRGGLHRAHVCRLWRHPGRRRQEGVLDLRCVCVCGACELLRLLGNGRDFFNTDETEMLKRHVVQLCVSVAEKQTGNRHIIRYQPPGVNSRADKREIG